jgi:hypothetical protein
VRDESAREELVDADHLAVGRHYDDAAFAYELERLERQSRRTRDE